ncbi:hypothetical protein [Uliginosibacterium sp. TH139]|uniref:hypothetical protein n=1 Tax=Uliginosibacterium sp. TH139 TaxID=2067453 RepID=UPI000C7C236C|nr:hypothetical protein [Uliginosibacterium sp. TH139]PLK47315.1 hypothetical protein C0V76_17990 [Uliginosibacterium sp. TH139]
MAHGQFSLYYLDTYGGRHASAQTHYQIVNDANTEITRGVTGANGETAQFPNTSATNQTFKIKVLNPVLARYEDPVIRVEDQTISQLHIDVLGSNAAGAITGKVALLSFQRAMFVNAATNKPIAGASFKAFMVDDKGKRVRARDAKSGQLIEGKTDAKGLTERIWCTDSVSFEFTYPGTRALIKTGYLEPFVQGGTSTHHNVPFKTISANTAPDANHTVPLAGVTSAPVVVNPQTQELLVVPRKDFEDFEKFSGQFDAVLRTKHQAQADLGKALESRDADAVAAAEKALGLAEDKVKETLNKNFKKLTDIREVYTFETTTSGKLDGKPKTTLRRRYINEGHYLKLKNNRLNREQFSIKLTVKDIDGTTKKQYEGKGHTAIDASNNLQKNNAAAKAKADKEEAAKNTDEAKKAAAKKSADAARKEAYYADKPGKAPPPRTPLGAGAVDRNLLTKSMSNILGELKTKGLDKNAYGTLDLPGFGGQLADSIEYSESFDTDYSAQWLRLVGAAGAQSQMDWRKGAVGISGNLQGKVVACEGSYAMHYAVPSRAGWLMTCGGQDMGAIRVYLELTLYGFAGAKVAMEGSATLKFIPGVGPSLEGKPRDKGPNYTSMVKTAWKDKNKPIKLPSFEADGENTAMPDGTGVKASVDAFAGAEVGITPKGSLQWLPPEKKDFISFADVAFDFALSAGAGAKANFHMYYAHGKFRFKMAAGLTWGVGAKGALDFAVNLDQMAEMVKWLAMQLQHVGFKQLVFIEKEAFQALSQVLVMLIGEQTPLGQALAKSAEEIDQNFNAMLKAIDRSDARKKMLDGIMRNPHWLVNATPETRGMLLYQMTRHWAYDHAGDTPAVKREGTGYLPNIHFLDRRKQAILKILTPVQLAKEWENVFQHMTAKGTKIAKGDAGHNEGDVLRLLNNGLNLSDDLQKAFTNTNAGKNAANKEMDNPYLTKFFEMKARLKGKFPKGYKVAMNDTPAFNISGEKTSPSFALAEIKDTNTVT